MERLVNLIIIVPALHRFHRMHPMIRIQVKRGLAREITTSVLNYSVEFGGALLFSGGWPVDFAGALSRRNGAHRLPRPSAGAGEEGRHQRSGSGVVRCPIVCDLLVSRACDSGFQEILLCAINFASSGVGTKNRPCVSRAPSFRPARAPLGSGALTVCQKDEIVLVPSSRIGKLGFKSAILGI